MLFCGLYLAGIPAAYITAVDNNMGVNWLWLGFAFGQAIVLFVYILVYLAVDW